METRAARETDLSDLQSIECAAGSLFTDLGMHLVADDEPPSLEYLADFVTDGRCWVITAADDRPVAYLLAGVVDGAAHIEQVSVRPDHAGRRLGAALIEHVAAWARHRGFTALTLTTYVDVPWNGPYYQTFGFGFLAPADETDELRAIRDEERARGLDRWPRACMRRELR